MEVEGLTSGIRTRRIGLVGPFILTALLALGVGILFRYYSLSGVGLYRMFATMGIVLTGLSAVAVIHRLQLAEAYAVFAEALADCGDSCRVWSARRPRRATMVHLLLTPAGLVPLTVDETGNRAKDRRQLQRAVGLSRSLREAAEAWRAAAPAADGGEDALEPDEVQRLAELPILPLVIWLRKALPQEVPEQDRRQMKLEHGDGWTGVRLGEKAPERFIVAQPEALVRALQRLAM